MLKSELNILEQQVTEIINNDHVPADRPLQEQLSGQVKSALETCAKLKKRWTQELFSPAKDHVVNRYVQFHQSGITRLSDLVVGLISVQSANAAPHTRSGNYEDLLNGFEDLLLFLKNGCYQFFDQDYKVTVFNNRRQRAKIAGLENELRLYAGPAIEPGLIKAIADSIRDKLKEADYTGISYRDIEHTTTLLEVVQQHLSAIKEPSTEKLQDAVYHQNLNTYYFYNWYKDRILKKIAGHPRKKEKEQLIMAEIQRISGVFVEPGKAFEPELPSIEKQVLAFLKPHLSYPSRVVVTDQLNNNSRLALDLSVPQFAVFIRVLYKCGCFPVNNVAKIVRFFAGHFTSKKQSDISVKSFSRAFYGMDQSAAAIVRDILQRMINYINKTYFH